MTLINKLSPVEEPWVTPFDWACRLENAVEVASTARLGVAIIARDVEHRIVETLTAVNDVAGWFESTRVAIVTNDCKDNTVELIHGIKGGFELIHEDKTLDRPWLGFSRSAERTMALAEYRNRCLDLLDNKHDYLLVLDADLQEVTAERLMAGFYDLISGKFDAIAAQNLVLLPQLSPTHLVSYDAFAFRPQWADVTSPMIERAFHYDVRPSGSDPFACRSAFGGAAWYTKKRSARYDGSQGCEHVPFNRHYRMAISPAMSLIGFLA